ncbi:thymidine kinase 2, mitochondrial isoform X3 [Dermacentor albipictus]|uniref:thymidine kinase 2, mitochondrial isoform X3 n=1 Tax=Dermacentor albipictus TaxID=60249 RepID=UPI0038FCF4D4
MFVSRVLRQFCKATSPLHFLDVVGDASILKAAGKGHTVKVAVEGNIGSGKTTFLEGCQQFVDTTVLIEPVTIWRDLQGQNLLELMYKEPKRWSLAFQTYVQLTMMQLHLAPVQTPVKLMERSLHSARYVFIENLYRSGHMTSLELSILDQWFGWINENVAVGLDMIIYLRTRPEVAMARIQKRKRPEEDQLPFDWLCQVHNLHEDWLLGRSKFPLPPKVLVIDANQDSIDIQQEFAQNLPDILGQRHLSHAPSTQHPV